MTGFIRGLFSKKSNDDADKSAPVERPKQEKVERPKKEKPARPPKENTAYFLESSEAQTYGNSEYMKTSKKTRRTFPKTADNTESIEYIQELSAMGRVVPGKAQVEVVAPKTESTESAATENAATPRRKAGSDMDMFRKMAKDVLK